MKRSSQRTPSGLTALALGAAGALFATAQTPGLSSTLIHGAEVPDGEKEEKASDDLTIVSAAQAPVPMTTFIKGGRYTIGSDPKDIEALLNDERYSRFVRILDSQTPQFSMEIPSFWIGTYEVTNQEYKVFVDATGYQPPIHWADDAEERAAQTEFARIEQEKFLAAKEKNQKYERAKWDGGPTPTPREKWWAENWRDLKVAIPKGEERFPVVYVDYEDAEAYCEWAGMRLPTEFEYQAAARGRDKHQFPWGDEWGDEKDKENPKRFANSAELRRAKPFPVGSFEEGVSKSGLYDLAGNVWEWTSSPYSPYEKFEINEYKIKGQKDKVKALPEWDPNQQVVVGGSFQEPLIAARITTRRQTARTQKTNALGFRVAASEKVGLDKAQLVFDNVIKNAEARPTGVEYAVEGVVAIDRWDIGAHGVSGYDAVLFVPVAIIEEASDNALAKMSREAPLHLGYLTTTIDMVEPAISAGTYLVGYRASGKAPRIDDDKDPKADKDKDKEKGEEGTDEPQEPAEEEVLHDPAFKGLDFSKDNLIFIDLETGEPAASMEAPSMKWGKGNPGGQFAFREERVRVGSGASAGFDDRTYLDLEVGIAGKVRRRQFPVTIALRPDKESAKGTPWRQ